jgi:hypothetical protein
MRGIKGLKRRPFPPPPKSPLSRQSLLQPTSKSSFEPASRQRRFAPKPLALIFLNFFLTIPITSYTITSPASLRSDHLIGINRNADRHHAGTLIDFPGIRKVLRILISIGPNRNHALSDLV